ncbi:MAG: GHKL domain-containing protein [Clostridia bacterium]|nr:GHKL domain-containing protein [Clostridia bacterium]
MISETGVISPDTLSFTKEKKKLEGKSAGTIIIGHDLTEEKRTLGKLIQEERLEALGELTGGAAHKFNNVLTVILSYIQFLLQETEEPGLEKIKKQLELVEKSAFEGAKVVSELREFVRGRKEAERVEVDLNERVKDVVVTAQFRWKDQAQAMGIRINTELDLGNPPPLMLNDYDLRRVLTEMIFNAVEALPEGGKIILATGREENQAYFSVTDTGVGVSPQTKKRIFDPFFTTKGPQINGLGLSVCYGIIKKYGGTIEVKSEESKGTTFTIRIPIHPQK